ncbi:hypothetical protein YC2023_122796 [Brassica napus]
MGIFKRDPRKALMLTPYQNGNVKREKREKVDLVPVSGRRVCARAVTGTSYFLWFNSHPEVLARGVNRHLRWMGCWSEGAVVWRGKRGEVILRAVEATKVSSLPAQVSGRCLASSASPRRSCLRGVKAYIALRRRL